MKNFLLLISLCLCSVISYATTYYVSPTGSDSNPGTLASPFKNWEKLSSVMHAGDIAYIRGGTYTSSHPASYGVHCLLQNLSGTSGSPIIIQNYAGEYPVLDLSGLGNPTASDPTAFYMLNCTYVTIKGLRITGLKQILNGSGVSRGMELWSSPNCTIEQVEIDHIGGFAFHLYNGSNDVLVKNCDVHHIDDRYSVPDAWGAGDGFGCTGGDNSTRTTYDGCRAWWCSDDGWDNFGTNAIVTYKNCWSFWNGYEPGTFTPRGNGEGFKLGPTQTDQTGTTLRFLNNCLSFHNADNGFDQNGTPTTKYQLENCTAYDNASWGFQFQYWPVSAGTIQHVFRNNAALGNGSGTLLNGGSNTYNDHNTWNGGVTISSTDFLSVSSTGVDGARQADGSLPSLNFLKLASSSDLINAGVNVGLPFISSAPDMGAFESTGTTTNQPPTANAGTDKSIILPVNSVSLTGSGTDPDGTITTYLWTKISGPTSGTITSANAATTSVTGLTQGIYQFQLKVTDNGGTSSTDIVQVTVSNAANQAPTANAGADKTVTLPTNTVSLSGSGTDADGTISSYVWTKVSGPVSDTITTATAASTTVTALVQGVYKFELKVTDNGGAIAKDTVQVTVNTTGNKAPTANAGADKIVTLPTSTVSLSGSGTDADGTIASYAWTKVSGPTSGIITTATAASTTVTALVQGVYKFQLKVTDNGGATGTDTVQVTVNAAGSTPTNNAYGGVRWAIPGTVQAENYDNGGQNNAYYDKTSGNSGGAYRLTESVDITNLSGGGYFVSSIVQGEWMKYSVNVTSSGTYTIQTNIACPTNGKSFNIEMDGTVIATVKVTNTNGSQKWKTVTIPGVNLTAGNKTMRIYAVKGGGYNLDYVKFTLTAGSGARLSDSDSTADEKTTVTTFPLPFSTSFTVNLYGETVGVYHLNLVDLSGNTVWKKDVNKNSTSVRETIYMSNLPGGVYILQVISPDHKISTHKLIKN